MNKLVLFGLMLVGIGSADKDTIVLTTGESMEGHMLSANENIVRFRDMRGIVEEIPREKLSTIRLTGTKQQNAAAPAMSTNSAPEAPEEQVRFCSLVGSFQREQMAYMQETNPIRKAGMRVPDPYRYEAQVRDLFGPKHEFVNWTGACDSARQDVLLGSPSLRLVSRNKSFSLAMPLSSRGLLLKTVREPSSVPIRRLVALSPAQTLQSSLRQRRERLYRFRASCDLARR